jgi:ergothioneine biosynthesis protein EgtB
MTARTDRQERAEGALAGRYARIRGATRALAEPLSPEDCVAQSMPDASPVKWHLAHGSWFFETFVLMAHKPGYQPFDPAFSILFNSYYNGIGPQHPRAERGLVTRPGLARVLDYRTHVDAQMESLLDDPADAIASLVTLGLAHEEQHQELLLTDLKHLLSRNPLSPSYAGRWPLARVAPVPGQWLPFPGGIHAIGHEGEAFAFDNEGPRHDRLLEPFALRSHPVTNAESVSYTHLTLPTKA